MSLLASTFSLATHIYPSSEVVDDHADNLVLLVLLHRFHAHFSPGHANRAAWETTADVPGPRIPAEKKNSSLRRSMPSSIGHPWRIRNQGYAFPPNSFLLSFFLSFFFFFSFTLVASSFEPTRFLRLKCSLSPLFVLWNSPRRRESILSILWFAQRSLTSWQTDLARKHGCYKPVITLTHHIILFGYMSIRKSSERKDDRYEPSSSSSVLISHDF